MDFIQLLLDLNIPAWVVLLILVVDWLVMEAIHHGRERRIKQLEHELERVSTQREKDLEFLAERHKKRLEALDAVTAALREFEHALEHLLRGSTRIYVERLQDYANRARGGARTCAALLGEEFVESVHRITDLGLTVLKSSFTASADTLAKLADQGLPAETIEYLHGISGRRFAVVAPESLVAGIDEALLHRHGTYARIFSSCEVVDGFDSQEYFLAERKVYQMTDSMLRSLPSFGLSTPGELSG